MSGAIYSGILLTASACGVAVGAMFEAGGWRLMVLGAVFTTNLALCALNIGLAIKEHGK